MTVFNFITEYVIDENEIHFYDKNANSIGMIPSFELVDKWIDKPIIYEDTWKAKVMPKHIISKILDAEFISVDARNSYLAICVDIESNDL